MARAAASLLIAVVVGGVAGWFVHDALTDDPPPTATILAAPPKPSSPTRAAQHASAEEIERLTRERDEALALLAAAHASSPAAPKPDAAELLAKRLGETLDVSTQAAVRDRAERLRKDLAAQAEAAADTVATQMKREIRAERREHEDRMRNGTMEFLRGLEVKWAPQHDWAPQWELVRSPAKFGALFDRKTNAGVIDGKTFAYRKPPADGTTIRFPAGTFALDAQAISGWTPVPQDLVVEGAGMDATLLVTNDEFEMRDPVHSLTLRDLTIDTNDHYLDEMRTEPYAMRMERCRVVGFDMGAGGSCMLGGGVGAFYADDCRFEAGFGRHPGSGELFDVRGALLVRVENCDVVGPLRSVFEQGNATQVFAKCRFTRMAAGDKSAIDHAGDRVEFIDCTFAYLTPDEEKAAQRQRPLSDLNPAWADAKKR